MATLYKRRKQWVARIQKWNGIKQIVSDIPLRTNSKLEARVRFQQVVKLEKDIKNGIKFNDILSELEEDLLKSDYIVAHNLNFDRSNLLAELTRNNRNDLIHLFESKKHICTLKETINVCCISRSPNSSYKWPKLSELYEKLFNRKLGNAHNARYDVENLSLCFFKLIENGQIRL